ncbi:MAG: phospho-sugar mutase [Polyangiaceae bacterium]|jgi:phosphomannomutase|nr:phospho-sugar mutase [Polyangiaceae bacterium]
MDAKTAALSWIEADPEETTREELRALVARADGGDAAAARELGDRFAGPLEFGTAGLRGVIGAGETRMNVAVVRRTTWGLGEYLLAHPDARVRERGVVIGYDGRRMSRRFAEETARVLAKQGIKSFLSPGVCPTPVAAYAVTRLGAAAGVMVTASHNPPEYNGYKVYWGNGAQIIPPHDKGIAAAIAKSLAARDVQLMGFDEARSAGLVIDFPADLEESYLVAVQALSVSKGGDRAAAIVYTPLHGVGDRLVRETLARAGFTNVTSVKEQAEPDGEFPTVSFPNPEEKGALDLSYALADAVGADLIIASDPDVDRLAIALRSASGKGFVQLTGNQVGVLLGHTVLTEGPQGDGRLVLASCVSSPQLGAIAEALGVAYEETLTGFKWIANRAMELEASAGKRFVFGYEEALGYTVGPLVRDKDGISAALVFAELWAARRSAGKTMLDELELIARRYGLYASSQLSVTMKGQDGLAQIRAVMARLRATRLDQVGPLAVEATTDVAAGTKVDRAGTTSRIALPPSDVLMYALTGGSRIIARPSGTEPKIKIYFDVREPMKEGEPLRDAEGRANSTLEALKQAFAGIAGL